MKIIVGDIHGRIDLLKELINKIKNKLQIDDIKLKENLWLAGDLFDRNYKIDSKEVVKYLIENKFNSVLGNHDCMLLDSFNYKNRMELFSSGLQCKKVWCKENNGGSLIYEYLNENEEDRNSVIEYLNSLNYFEVFEEDKIVLSHSILPHYINNYLKYGYDVNKSYDVKEILKSIPNSLYSWANEVSTHVYCIPSGEYVEPIKYNILKDYKFVLGHYAYLGAGITPDRKIIFTDSGAFYTGILSAVIIDGDEISIVDTEKEE